MSTSFSCLAAVFLAKRFTATTPTVSAFVSKSTSRSFTRCSSSVAGYRLFSSGPLGAAAAVTSTDTDMVPITLLSGFLGSGKTTTLQHLLENKEGLKIGVIVNDVASVNIDAKLVKQSDSSNEENSNIVSRGDGVIELQNGCACCSLADELLPTVETLIETGKSSSPNGFDAIVVELSGVGDPIAIQQHWKMNKAQGHPVTNQAEMKRVVTLIDSSTFGTDWMTWETAGDRDGWVDPDDVCAEQRKVPELLAEQIEAADVLLLNKIDLAGDTQLKVAEALAASINDKAVMEKVAFGKVAAPIQILRDDISIVEETSEAIDDERDGHDHSHSHTSLDEEDSDIAAASVAATDDDNDKDDRGHSHSHSHSHNDMHENHKEITSFVYKADRPFNTRNLMSLLNTWPVPIKDNLEGLEHFQPEDVKNDSEPAGRESPFFGVLRSKGFCWLSPTQWKSESSDMGDEWRHDTAMYWSHAGKHFGITTAGKWWATLERSKMKQYFASDPKEYERIITQDFVTPEWGDRRQEIVFIGVNLDQEKITESLDRCLLGEVGMKRYTDQVNNFFNMF